MAVFTEFYPDNADKKFKEGMEAAAQRLGLQLQYLEARGPDDFDAVFSLARRGHAKALAVIATNLAVSHRSRLAALAAADGLPSISEFPLMAQAGFLLTYGADLDDLGRRSIAQIDKILKGAHAGDLPIERPTKYPVP
ncbi:ABC transporter substrate binding protein [Variovorax brevis]|uniref:ABC transporter substrate binding protein n=1 Tax=Variovorax brevis TaxID=3053503 RepID=UPI0033653DD5